MRTSSTTSTRNALGFQQMEENEFILDASYVVKGVKFFAFFDYDISHTSQTQRSGRGRQRRPRQSSQPHRLQLERRAAQQQLCLRPGHLAARSCTRLSLIVQYDFEKNNGRANFTSQSFTAAQTALGINNGNIDIAPWDDYTRQNISARLIYEYNQHLAFSLGYLYSQFRMNDGQYNGYQYVAFPRTPQAPAT